MMSDLQHEALAVLKEVWHLSPDIRMGQLMAHLGFLGEVHLGRGLGYIDDDELVSIMYKHRAELLARLEGERKHLLQPAGSASLPSSDSRQAPLAPS